MPLPNESTTLADVLARAASGSSGALAELFHEYGARVHRVAFRLMLSADDAEDVVQDVFVGLPEALRAFSGSGTFDAWLRTVTVRTALMRMRASRRREAVAIRAGDLHTIEPEAVVDRLAIATALAALPQDLRIVFVLRDVEGYTHAEIGRMLGIRAGTSEVRLHRARRRLRELLGDR